MPLPPRPPDPQRLTSARAFLGDAERRLALGPYALYTDVRDDRLIALLGRLAGELDAVYAKRHGRTPLGTPQEAVVLYRGEVAYRLLQQGTEDIAGLAAAGHSDRGLAALYVGERSATQVAATLIHELVHFLNRRALGPQLPPWLDEGIADDLALSRIDPPGHLRPEILGGREQRSASEWRLEGGRAALHGLRTTRSRPPLSELLELDWRRFVEPSKSRLHYSTSAFWVRYLLDGEDGRYAARWRDFLAAVAAGEPPSPAELQRRLGVGWERLEKDFQTWIAGSGSSSRHTASPSA